MAEEYEDTMEPPLKTDANFQRRLMNFKTGDSDLRWGHMQWLDSLLQKTPDALNFHCHIYGYASKLGDAGKNEKLAYDRASAVARYLEVRNPRYTSRIETFRSMGEEDPNYVAGESDNSPMWRAVEVHLKYDRPPIIKVKVKIPRVTHTKWSVCGYFSLMKSVLVVGQFGVSFFKFRNDETKEVRTFIAPMFGGGVSFDAMQIFEWVKNLKEKRIPGFDKVLAHAEEIMKNPALLAQPKELLKKIGKDILTGSSTSDWTDFTQCETYVPLTFQILNGQTIGNVSATGGVYQTQKIIVYGKVWYTEQSGAKMFGTKDILSASSSGWQAQVPALSGGAVGGPLLLL